MTTANNLDYTLKINTAPWTNRIQFAVMARRFVPETGRFQYFVIDDLGTVKFRQIDEAEIIQPTFEIDRNNMQEVIDELWKAGLRPSEYSSHGELSATKKHLNDFRKIVSNLTCMDFEK